MKSKRTLVNRNKALLPFAVALAMAVVSTARAADYPTTILADHPLAYYRLEETSGTTAVDSSASGIFPGVYVQNGSYPILGLPGIDTNSIDLSAAESPDYVNVGYYSQLNQPGPFSFEVWARPTSIPTSGNYRCPIGNSPAYGTATQSGWYVYQTPDVPSELALVTPTSDVFISTTNYSIDNWYHIAGTYDGTNMSFYLNGVLVGAQRAGAYVANSVNNAGACVFGIGQRGDGYGNFDGDLDEAAFYTNALTAAQILNHYQVGTNSFRIAALPPSIADAPAAASVYAGQAAQFTVQADGSTPLYYQWYNGSTLIPNATNTSYSFVTGPSDNGSSFTVIITNFVGSITSTPAALSVSTGSQIDAPLTSITRNVGSTAAFEIVAEGAQPLTYQWYDQNNDQIPGATNSILWLTNVQASANGNSYYVDIANPYTTNQSASATLTVQARPVVETLGAYAKVVEADGPVAFWQLDETNGSTNAVDSVGSFDGAYTTNYSLSPYGNGTFPDGIFTFGEPSAVPNATNTAVGVASGAVIAIPYAIEINPPGAFSVEGWFQASSVPANGNDYRTPISSMSDPYGAGPNGWLVYQTGNNNNWSWWPYNGYYAGAQLTDTDPVIPNQWYYLTMVYDGTTFTFYVDGIAKSSGTDSGFCQNGNVPSAPNSAAVYNYNYSANNGSIAGSYPTVLGWRGDTGFNPFDGSVDNVAVYNKALTQQQIQYHFLSTTHLTASISANKIIVSWSAGTLESATKVTGPYTVVAGATSPYTNSSASGQIYYRARLQ
jgi:hypothetical protein